jgi:hypothetical protein
MHIENRRPFRHNGTTRYAYDVVGTAVELADYKEIQGEFHRENPESKKPQYFDQKVFIGKLALVPYVNKEKKRNVFVDDSEFQTECALIRQSGGDVNQYIQDLMKKDKRSSTPAETPAPEESGTED